MIGPFTYSEEVTVDPASIKNETIEGQPGMPDGQVFNFTQSQTFTKQNESESVIEFDINQEITTFNFEAFAQLKNLVDPTDWLFAIRALNTTITAFSEQLKTDMILNLI